MANIINRSKQDNINILVNFKVELERITTRLLVAQSEYEINDIESELASKKAELEGMNDYNDRALKREIGVNLCCINNALVLGIIARNQR